jgi:hypothetical protein
LEVLAGIPPVSDFLWGYESGGFMGIGAPKNTPFEIIDKLDEGINAGLADAKNKGILPIWAPDWFGGPGPPWSLPVRLLHDRCTPESGHIPARRGRQSRARSRHSRHSFDHLVGGGAARPAA